jgi:hypothetical protein
MRVKILKGSVDYRDFDNGDESRRLIVDGVSDWEEVDEEIYDNLVRWATTKNNNSYARSDKFYVFGDGVPVKLAVLEYANMIEQEEEKKKLAKQKREAAAKKRAETAKKKESKKKRELYAQLKKEFKDD